MNGSNKKFASFFAKFIYEVKKIMRFTNSNFNFSTLSFKYDSTLGRKPSPNSCHTHSDTVKYLSEINIQ